MEEEEEDTSSTTDEKKMEGGRRRKQKTKRSRKTNNALKEWVKFVKKVRAEEKIDSYKKAMSRAKVRADKGEKWRSMKGGEEMDEVYMDKEGGVILGGRRRKSRGRSRHRTMRRSRRRSSRRH